MTVYYINLFLILALAWPLCLHRPANWKKMLFLMITFGYMWALATLRRGIGFDYYSYINIFGTIQNTDGLKNLLGLQWEPGFVLLTKGMALFIADNPTLMYGVYEVLILVPVVWFIYRYCREAWLSTWLFVTLTFYYTSMNFIRQSLACSVSLLGYKFLREKKPVPYFLIVLLAASFHKTALIMIPLYFLCHIRLNKVWACIYGGGTLLGFLLSGVIVDIFTDYFFTYYKNTVWLEGMAIRFLLVPFMVFATCLALKVAWEKWDPDATLLLNLMMFSAIIWLFITRHFILERFSMFVYIYVILALPSAVSTLLPREEMLEHREQLRQEVESKRGKPSKELQGKLKKITQDCSDRKKYYWSAVAAILVVTAVYNDFGGNVNGFHGVFPYKHIFQPLEEVVVEYAQNAGQLFYQVLQQLQMIS